MQTFNLGHSKDVPFMDSKYSYDSKAVRSEYKKLNLKVLLSGGLLVPYCLVEPQRLQRNNDSAKVTQAFPSLTNFWSVAAGNFVRMTLEVSNEVILNFILTNFVCTVQGGEG